MIELTAMELVWLISAVITMILGICLLVIMMPEDSALRNYRIARIFIALAYLALSSFVLLGLFGVNDPGEGMLLEGNPLEIAIMMIVAPFQALLYTASLITLINPRFVTMRRVLGQVVVITVFFVAVFATLSIVPGHLFRTIIYIATAIYSLQLYFYTVVFFKQYNNFRHRLDHFYSDTEKRRLLWVRKVYFLVLLVGVGSAISDIAGSQIGYIAFIIFYTVIYILLVVKYINYIHQFQFVTLVISKPTQDDDVNLQNDSGNISTMLHEWIALKGFIQQDITLESLSTELHTNQTYLSRYINSEYGQNFKTWINSMRIAEAQRLIVEEVDIPIALIAEKSGIKSSSTFYRNFVAVTGMTPAEYRKSFDADSDAEINT